MGTGSFPGVKWPGSSVDHPLHLALRLKKEYSYKGWNFNSGNYLFTTDTK